jgi:heat shock protein HtpX
MSEEPVNLFEQQAANRRRSRWLVAAFVIFFAWLGFGGDWIAWQMTKDLPPEQYHHVIPFGGLLLFIIGFLIVGYIRKTGAEKVLWSAGATRLDDPQTPQQRMLVNVVEEMSIAAGVPKPTLWLIEDADPNAFATGNDPMKSHIAVTTGLIEACNRDELQGVIGHELGHVKNLDMQLMTMVAGLVGAVALMSDGLGRMMWHSGGRRSSRSSKNNLGGLVAVVLVLWLISWILAPIITRLMAVGISRKREFLADAMSAQFTRNPLALAAALEKIEGHHGATKAIKGGVAHLCIADPLGRSLSNRTGAVANLFATHPPMAMRVARLKAMGYQEQKAAGNFQTAQESLIR